MIYNKFIYLLVFMVAFGLPVYSSQKASVEYNERRIDYSVIDRQQVLTEADSFFDKYEETNESKYLTTAMAKYYILTRINPTDLYSTVQLAKTYDINKNDRQAKKYFNVAMDINKNDAYFNYNFAEYYYARKDYKRALKYYEKAYKNGYSENFDTNLKIATIYEKFADLEKAKYYYEKTNSIKKTQRIDKKINNIKKLNYEKSEYYGTSKK